MSPKVKLYIAAFAASLVCLLLVEAFKMPVMTFIPAGALAIAAFVAPGHQGRGFYRYISGSRKDRR